MRQNSVTGAIFAGGESSRFGSSKANALVDGEEFGFRIVRSVRQAGIERILLIGGNQIDASRWNTTFVSDEFLNAGPLSALLSAMHNCSSDVLLIMPCDVPWIDPDTCLQLSKFDTSFDVQVAFTDSPQWLCSAWRKSTLNHLEQQFANGERAIHRAVDGLSVNYLELPPKFLRNINTPNDLIS